MNIVTPCHRRPLRISTTSEGPAYMQRDVPDEIWCEEPGCYNSWDANGVADEWNKYPEETVPRSAPDVPHIP